ncbi:MAG TPA: pantetheine-phosphate adenylyltransferase [Candidatus Margulisiibacteriota bacterium]|nr:pantetheine-phosphate adenylyltransferase [Candidatus Margulisiibacteriota bacterium]
MRVIAGSAKGRRLGAGRGMAVRPTADKVKGALFNILASRFDIDATQLLDLFAGSGALGIEALSRGAAAVTFVEQSAASARVLRENLQRCGFNAQAHVLQMPVRRALAQLEHGGARVDGVFADPPYGHGLVQQTLAAVAAHAVLKPGGWLVIEHHVDEAPPASCGTLRLTQARRYGKTGLALFVADEHMPAAPQDDTQIVRAVYPGSFDPITNGHLDVVRRAVTVFDQVIVAVAATSSDPHKDGSLFTADERVALIRDALADTGGRAIADKFSGLLVDYCDRVGARVIIRGLRAVSDFEYEFQMAMMNRHMKPHIETFFMAAGAKHFYTASRLVKQVARLGGDVRELLPEAVYRRLLDKVGRK